MAQHMEQENQSTHVWIEDEELILAEFRERDSEVVAAVESADDPDEAVHRLLGVGARAAHLAATSLDTAVVSSAFERMGEEFDRTVSEAAERISTTSKQLLDDDGTLNGALGAFKEEFAALIEKTFDADDRKSALSRLDETMAGSTEKLVRSVRSLLDPDDDESPLGRYRKDVVREIREQAAATTKAVQDLAERVAVRSAEAELIELTTAKGFTFEELVHGQVSRITAPFEDVAERVSTMTGTTGAKVGDEVITLNPEDARGHDVRYVLECKDRRMPSLKKVLDELAEAMANREASAGVAVFATQDKAPIATPFESFGDKAIAVLDKDQPDEHALALACAWARWVVRRSLVDDSDEVDLDQIGAAVEDGRRALARISNVRRAHSAAKKRIDEASGQVDDLVGDVEAVLDTIGRVLRS